MKYRRLYILVNIEIEKNNMPHDLDALYNDIAAAIDAATTLTDLEHIDADLFSRKSGKLTLLMKSLKTASVEERKTVGQAINAVKERICVLFEQKKASLLQVAWQTLETDEAVDVTQTGPVLSREGHLHPLTLARRDMERVARGMGFIVEDGPELDSDYYTFESLNIPPSHPARESQDTFYIKGHANWCMRSHVSNMQVRLMRKYGAPLRAAYPGRVFRNEATDASHEHTFYQFEALVVDKHIHIGHLIGIIKQLLTGLYGREVDVRLRPSYFPFVEPGFEMDMRCLLCDGNGCPVCKRTGWVEMLGCGLIHPHVLTEAGLDPKEYTGLAFGMGLTRLVMMRYGIDDIRHLQAGDLRFLQQF